jgi:hypothetical protein
MCCHSEFSDIIHLESPDLDFCRETEHAEHRSMDALIPVEFRNGDIVFDFFDERSVILVDDS